MAANHFPDNYNSGIDPSDMDCYFDFSQSEYHSHTPSSLRPSASKLSPPSATIDPINTIMSPDQDEKPQYFSGPSHDYLRFKQQTPFPTGAIQKVTTANNTFDSDSKYSLNTADLNFGASMGYNSGMGMDLDFDSSSSQPLPAYFYPTDSSPSDEFIDPSAIGVEEPPSNVGRLWPGMHSQQAEQAKAEADAKKQQQHQMMLQRAQQHSSSTSSQQKSRNQSHAATDPVVEERISRLLDQMRHSSTSSMDDPTSPNDGGLPHIARMRKEEEDMDEDERLLASEEGKKLSSKERRQLRNKVSARAFRSRRKEYISQLEGEVNAKAEECDELKMQVRRLNDQNAQLTSLTQTLLRHPAFSTVLTEMSNDPTVLAPPPQSVPKDVNPYQATQQSTQENIQVGLTMMPETSLDFSTLNLGAANDWNNTSSLFTYQPQVFSIFDLPSPSTETLRPEILAGKANSIPSFSGQDTKLTAPVIELPVTTSTINQSEQIDISDIKDDPTYALYIHTSTLASPLPQISLSEAAHHLESSLSGKPDTFALVIPPTRTQSPEALERMFAAADDACRRLETLTRMGPL